MGKFKVGDVVRLNSDPYRPMTVNSVGEDVHADCYDDEYAVGTTFFTHAGELSELIFHKDMLTKVEIA